MSTVTGILGGALTLAAAQLLLSSPRATSAFGTLATVPASWIEKFMDASVAAIPNHPLAGPTSAPAAPSAAVLPAPGSLPPAVSPPVLSV